MTSSVQENSGKPGWMANLLRFVGFLIVPAFAVVMVGGLAGHPAWLGYALVAMLAAVILFPRLLDCYFGATRHFPRLLLALALLPSMALTGIVFSSAGKHVDAPAQPVGRRADAAPANRAAAPAATPLAAERVAPPAPAKAETLSWSANYLKNDTSRVVLGLTSTCTAYFGNGKVAATAETTVDFTDSAVGVPVLPGESRKLRPAFSFKGSRDDVDDSRTRCDIGKVTYAEHDEDLPVSITLASKKSAYYGDYRAMATIANQSAKELNIKKLKLACVIRNDRGLTDEEMLASIKSGVYAEDDMSHVAYYYDKLVAKPFSSNDETQLKIPAGGSEQVRLYKTGGMFSSDEELGLGDFSKYQCWVPD